MEKNTTKVKRSSQGSLVIWDGMKLSGMVQLLKMKPSLQWNRIGRILPMPFLCTYNTVMGAAEDLLYGRKIAQTEISEPPIFILGYWRSGTTLLHNLMTLDERSTYPTLYQTLFPWHFLTTQTVATALTGWMVPKSRPMDNVAVSWNTPQEDDVALTTMCLVSPYMYLARPADMDLLTKSFDIDALPEQERLAWENAMTLLMKKITVRDPKRIVLKSPAHTYRIAPLLRLFPEARFVFIHRNPYDVFNSTIHLRKTMVAENTLGEDVHPNIENSVIDTFLYSHEAYQRDKVLIPEGRLHEVKYEELAADPMGQLESIYNGLSLGGFDSVKQKLEPMLPELTKYKKNKFSPNSFWKQEVYNRCREVYDRYGYPAPDDETETAAA